MHSCLVGEKPVPSQGVDQRLAKLAPGGHLCLFYDGEPAEQLVALVPYIREGLEGNERVIYIADDQTVAELQVGLNQAGIDVDHECSQNRLCLFTRKEWRQPGELRSDRKAEQVRRFVAEAQQSGFAGIRFAVEMTWTLGPDIAVEKLRHWEATLNTVFEPSFPGRIICQYNRRRLSPEALLAALHTHPEATVGSHIYPNPFYETPLILNASGNGHTGNGNGIETRPAAERVAWMLGQMERARAAEEARVEAEALRRANLERQQTQAILEASEQRLRTLVNHSPECIKLVDETGLLLEINPAGLAMIEADRADQVIGRSIYDLILPEDLNSFRALHEQVCRGNSARLEFRIVGLKGTQRWVETNATPIVDADRGTCLHLAITRDITGRREEEEARRRLAAIVQSSDDAIISKDLDGVIMTWNAAAQRIFGYTANEAIGQHVTMLIPAERADEEPGILSQIRQGQRIDHYETVRQRKDGGMVDISLTVSPIKDSDGRIIGASKIARDISARRRAEAELRATRDELRRLNAELESRVKERTASLTEAIAQMEEFSYTVSHDLRAPARAMREYTKIVLEEAGHALDAQAKDHLERVIRGAERMDRLIQDVLTYSRMSRREVQLQAVNLDRVVADLIQQNPELQTPRAQTTVRSPLLPVLAHEASLAQAISNLLTNAAKFVPHGEIPRITVRTETRGDRVRLWIEDNGIGIKPEHQRRLFGVFERLPAAAKYEGTGIGLAIVRKAVEKMGGAVGLESDGLTGSRFWIQLAAPPPNTEP